MLKIRKAKDRGHIDMGWLNTWHSFSFGEYFDPAHMGFKSLRVINEDFIKPDSGFPTHPHRDMEIITYMISGSLAHKDSMGNGSVIKAGDIQYMSAGSGVMHSEHCPSNKEKTHLLQIWIMPDRKGGSPRYDQKHILTDEKLGKLKLLVSSDGHDGSISIYQAAELYASILNQGMRLEYTIKSGRSAYVQLISGKLNVNTTTLQPGDGLMVENENMLIFDSDQDGSEFLLFDLSEK